MNMKVLPINQSITFCNNSKSVIETNNQTNQKLTKEKVALATVLGLLGLNTLVMLDRTSRTRIEKLLIKEEKVSKSFKNNFTELSFDNLKNNNSVMSLDEISGLNKLKDLINKMDILLKNKDVIKEHKIESSSSILLWGLPGTGKTTVAKSIAKKLDADFVILNKEFFDSCFVGEGPQKLSSHFETIKNYSKNNPNKKVVVFMDEIDGTISIDNGNNARHSDDLVNVMKRYLTDLQTECDNIIFIGATNKDPSGFKSDNKTVKLNNAILSRFNYQFEIGLPEKSAIKDAWSKLVKTQSGKEKFTEKENELISETFHKLGMSYRDIKNISNKLNIDDAVEFCKKRSYNSKANLIQVLKDDEKVGYDHIKKVNMDTKIKDKLISDLEKKLSEK